MSDQYSLALLNISLAQLCQNVGFQSCTNISLSVLLDIYRRYLETMCTTLHRYTEHAGRTKPVLEDVELMFRELRITSRELNEYVNQVAPVPFKYKVPIFPVRRPSRLKIPPPDAEELLTRPDYIPPYLPLMQPEPEPEPEPVVAVQKQPASSDSIDDSAETEGRITSARINKGTISAFGKQNLSQSSDLIGDFNDFDAVKAGLVKFVRIPTPPPPPRVSTPLAVSYPPSMSPASSSSVFTGPVITVAEEKAKKKHPTVLAVRPEGTRFAGGVAARGKLKMTLPSMAAYKKKRVMPLIVQRRDKKFAIPQPGDSSLDTEKPVKRRGRPPGKVGRPPKRHLFAAFKPPAETHPVIPPAAISAVDNATTSVNLDTSSASSSIEDLVTSVIEATRTKMKAQQIATEHFADSVNSVVVAQNDVSPVDLSKSEGTSILDPAEEQLPQRRPEVATVDTTPEVPSTSADHGHDQAPVMADVEDGANSEKLKSILSNTRRLLNKEIIKQRLKDKTAKREEEEKKIKDVVEKTFAPIAKRTEEPAPVQKPSVPTPSTSASTSTSKDDSAKAPRRPPGIPPTSVPGKQKIDKTVRITTPKPEPSKMKKYEPPPLFQPEHITKTVIATAATENRKVAPLVISKKPKPAPEPVSAPPLAPEPKRRESTKLIIKLPHKTPLSTSEKERRKHEQEKEHEKHKEKEHEKYKEKEHEKYKEKHRDEPPASSSDVGKEKKGKQASKNDPMPPSTSKKVDVSAAVPTAPPKVPKLKINLGPKPAKAATTDSDTKTKEKKVKPTKVVSSLVFDQQPQRLDLVGDQRLNRSPSPVPKSPTAHADSPLHAGSNAVIGGYESPPPPTPSPGSSIPPASPSSSVPPSPVYLDTSADLEMKSDAEVSSPPNKKQRVEAVPEVGSHTTEQVIHSFKPSKSAAADHQVKHHQASVSMAKEQESHPANDGGWYCPVCNVPYMDGGPDMIACDMCDRWFHWACVGLMQAPPADENWYCQQCRIRRASASFKQSSAGGQKRKQKNSMIKKRQK